MNWFLNLLDPNVMEREIKREKVQMKPPYVTLKVNNPYQGHKGFLQTAESA